MLNSPTLEVAIGLVFCFASVALMASVAKEAMASALGWRAKTLWSGIGQLVNDPAFNGLALKLFNHALVNPAGDGSAKALPQSRFGAQLPSYVDTQAFAQALLDLVHQGEHGWQALGQSINQLQPAEGNTEGSQLYQWLSGLYKRVNATVSDDKQKLAAVEQGLSNWFDAAMDRLSGAYKRKAQWYTFVAGLVIAAGLNIDAIHLSRELWKHQTVVSTIAPMALKAPPADATASQTAEWLNQDFGALAQLPVGRSWLEVLAQGWQAVVFNVLGVLLTASAAMFGAPFWFDLLQKLVQLRSTGPRPGEGQAAAASSP